MNELLAQMQDHLPPVFAGVEIDQLTGNAIRWRTIQNLRACRNVPERKKIPQGCFKKDGNRKILIVRDPFLSWWFTQLEDA
ncbi:hypothetical protein [Desulfovibrio psychrotolerans]|uniref:hypothetical protein n=1 Tax=Desulfovibrio psychrotolerans TaxID=415242 RepID=UPI00157B97FB|nr:hypothetical protein [Desulfovibrio psychrotolerans]